MDGSLGFQSANICVPALNSELCQTANTMINKYNEVLVSGDKCLVIPRATNATWFDARRECEKIGAWLATIDSEAIQGRLLVGAPGLGSGWLVDGFWIGLTRVKWIWQLGNISIVL